MLRKYIREQLRHPTLHGIRVAINKGTNSKNGSMALANSGVVDW